MINFKNIIKVLLLATFICALSGEVRAQICNPPCGAGYICKWELATAKCVPNMDLKQAGSNLDRQHEITQLEIQRQRESNTMWKEESRNKINEIDNKIKDLKENCGGKCKANEICYQGNCVVPLKNEDAAQEAAQDAANTGGGGPVDANFCSGDFGIFSGLVTTGQLIFKRLRDLIYVVAGFGIIAVAVGGFFGNLNWKWLGAIVISLVVIATAGELIVLITGCEQFGSSLITNTLLNPTEMSTAEYQEKYTEAAPEVGQIQWNDSYAIAHPETYAGTRAEASREDFDDSRMKGYDTTSDEVDVKGNPGLLSTAQEVATHKKVEEDIMNNFSKMDEQIKNNAPKMDMPKFGL